MAVAVALAQTSSSLALAGVAALALAVLAVVGLAVVELVVAALALAQAGLAALALAEGLAEPPRHSEETCRSKHGFYRQRQSRNFPGTSCSTMRSCCTAML